MAADKVIHWEVKEGNGFLTLCNPPENKMDSRFFEELEQLTSSTIPQSDYKAIIISGQSRHFSSGADLEDLLESINQQDRSNILASNLKAFNFFSDLKVPVIAAVSGVCLGSGSELALHCHFRLCAENTILGLPETTFGLMPGLGGIQKLMRLAGKAKTIELIAKGNHFNAHDALNWGIVDAVYPKKEFMDKAILLANMASVDYRKYRKNEYLKKIE